MGDFFECVPHIDTGLISCTDSFMLDMLNMLNSGNMDDFTVLYFTVLLFITNAFFTVHYQRDHLTTPTPTSLSRISPIFIWSPQLDGL